MAGRRKLSDPAPARRGTAAGPAREGHGSRHGSRHDGLHRRRRPTTAIGAAGFWLAFLLSGIFGLKLVDRIVGLSTDWVDRAVAAPPRERG